MFGRGESPVDLRVTGAEDLARIGKALRQAGTEGRGLRKELLKGIRTAVGGPMRKATRESWRSKAPHRGGLNKRGLRMAVQTNTRNGDSLGVRLITKSPNGYNLDSIDKTGAIRHPVFGRRNAWAVTRIAPGIFTEPQEAAAPDVRKEIIRVIDAVNRKIEGT